MVGVSNIGNARSFLSICVQDGMIIPKMILGLVCPFHTLSF